MLSFDEFSLKDKIKMFEKDFDCLKKFTNICKNLIHMKGDNRETPNGIIVVDCKEHFKCKRMQNNHIIRVV